MKIYAATGHRPEKLGGYHDSVGRELRKLARWFLTQHRPDSCISGMALGWDTAWAEAALELEIPLIAAVPFVGQECMWPFASKRRYDEILSQAERIVHVCDPGYAVWKMQKRNQWMVDNSTAMIALWDGSPGGTGNCMEYAMQSDKEIVNLYPFWHSQQF